MLVTKIIKRTSKHMFKSKSLFCKHIVKHAYSLLLLFGLFPIKDMYTPPPSPPLSFDHSLFIDDTEPLTHYK